MQALSPDADINLNDGDGIIEEFFDASSVSGDG